jgi:hypothetical protein
MDREALIQTGNAVFNLALAANASEVALPADLWAADADLAEQMESAFKAARQPETFIDEAVWRLDERFEMCYELMRITFDADVLDPRSFYVDWLKDRTEPPPDLIMIGRFWRALGRHRYSPDGKLVHFEFDPFVTTESVASVVLGNYFSHNSAVLGRRVGIGGLGYLATRPEMRGKGGHGRHLTAVFETALHKVAAERGEPLRGVLLESEDRARGFWSKMGFRAAEGSRYIQPPLSFDPDTGAPITNLASETFMIKYLDGVSPDVVQRDELLEWLHLAYEHWYSPELNNAAATARARALVFDELYGIFRDSLPAGAGSIPLVAL